MHKYLVTTGKIAVALAVDVADPVVAAVAGVLRIAQRQRHNRPGKDNEVADKQLDHLGRRDRHHFIGAGAVAGAHDVAGLNAEIFVEYPLPLLFSPSFHKVAPFPKLPPSQFLDLVQPVNRIDP